MKEAFKDYRFGGAARSLIVTCNGIIETYQGMGLRLTLRQLYSQLVSRNVVPNTERSYKNVGNLLSRARLAGLVDWDAIEDRVRVPDIPSQWNSIGDIVDSACRAFRLPRWADQDRYLELWVEKDALSGVLAPLASEYHVPLAVNRGYSSQSAMKEAAERFRRFDGKPLHLIYLGDHDPSGEDMVRDVRERLAMFGVEVDVEKIALTMEQVRKYRPPPNPAKITDSRAAAYIARHGDSSWEVDALPPDVLTTLIRKAITKHMDLEAYKAVIERERGLTATLRKVAGDIE